MNSYNDFNDKVKYLVEDAWQMLFGAKRKTDLKTVCSAARAVMTDAEKTIKAVFSLPKIDKEVQRAKIVREAGLRSMTHSELHKAFQLSRRDKLQKAANTEIFIVRKNGGIDILMGGANHVTTS